MSIVRHMVLHGTVLALGVAAVCFLLLILMGKTGEDELTDSVREWSFAMPQSPARIVDAADTAAQTLGWMRTATTATSSNASFAATTPNGTTVKLSITRPAGRPSRVNIETTAFGATHESLAQQMHDALLAAIH